MARTQGSHAQITRPRVRAAALKLIASEGFAAVSMRRIAAEVGVQAGALYNYTPDKQTLLFDIMQEHLSDLLTKLAAMPVLDDPVAALERFTRHHIRYHSERPDEVFIAYMELRNLTDENFARIEALRGAYEDQLETILRVGQGRGVFDVPDAKITTLAVIAMLTGVNTWFREGGRLSLDEVEAVYWAMVQRAVSA